jgi:hypothetical protein
MSAATHNLRLDTTSGAALAAEGMQHARVDTGNSVSTGDTGDVAATHHGTVARRPCAPREC